jgi:hypothetical protein
LSLEEVESLPSKSFLTSPSSVARASWSGISLTPWAETELSRSACTWVSLPCRMMFVSLPVRKSPKKLRKSTVGFSGERRKGERSTLNEETYFV